MLEDKALIHSWNIPSEVSYVTHTLQNAGFEAYLVGGCVRDLFMKRQPKDWDVATNARPEQVLQLFEHAFYENDFGTVGVVNKQTKDKTLEIVEVTTYRLDADYRDSRHPEYVTFSDNLLEDLKRRDFTINALAYDLNNKVLVDQYGGQNDITKGLIRAVGEPQERFKEDALRMMRAVRLASELSFAISHETFEAIVKNSASIKNIAIERIRDEFIKILESNKAMIGIDLLNKASLLEYIIPELRDGIDISQNQAHKYDVWEHNLRTLQHSADKNWPIDIRLSALFHDIGKPTTRCWSEEKNDWTFHGHDVIGGKIAEKVLTRMKFPKKTIDKVSSMVRWHMFFSDPDKITLSAVRRLMRNVGQENVWDLMNLRICDRIGTGRPKEQPYRFRKYQAMIEEAMRSPTSVQMLNINGNYIKDIIKITPGPKIGFILHTLLEEVLDNPDLNNTDYLEERVRELGKLSEKELEKLGKQGRERKNELENNEVKKIREKYWVK